MLGKVHEDFNHQRQELLGFEVTLLRMLHLQLDAARPCDGLNHVVEHGGHSVSELCTEEGIQHMLRQLLHHRQHLCRCLKAPTCLTVHGLQVLLRLVPLLFRLCIPCLSVGLLELSLPDVSQLQETLVDTVDDIVQHHVDKANKLCDVLALSLQRCDVMRKLHDVHEQLRHVMPVVKLLVELVVGIITPCHLNVHVEADERRDQELARDVMLLEEGRKGPSTQLEPFVPPSRYQKAHNLQQFASQVGIPDIYIVGREDHEEVEQVLQDRHAHQLQRRDVHLCYHP
mmetsp:Transcript_1690/g.5137  ORF Transcript_1690/g.5137 Transcript_1690/m.5137 type:complete len:285 (+) Transcript_1690:1769-2623(+)